uniref:F-box domain-containing protein n=1 Tax=Hemiselmis andersenii TaxID=464988 RepID=A0A7S1MUQ7_HEMAN
MSAISGVIKGAIESGKLTQEAGDEQQKQAQTEFEKEKVRILGRKGTAVQESTGGGSGVGATSGADLRVAPGSMDDKARGMCMATGACNKADMTMLSDEMLRKIALHLPVKHIVLLSATSRQHKQVLDADDVWKRVCEEAGFKQRSATRTRGSKPWKEVYKANLCIECSGEGRVNININLQGGGTPTSLVTLCEKCFRKVSKLTFSERTRHVLPRTWEKHGKFLVQRLFTKVPIRGFV